MAPDKQAPHYPGGLLLHATRPECGRPQLVTLAALSQRMLHRPAHTVTLAGASAARLRLLGCSHGPAATAALRRRHCSSRVVAMAARDPEARQAHKQAVKEAKAAKRLQKQGLGDPMAGAKPCTLCDRPRNLLVRCQVDASGAWQMACGRCWLAASGGQVDGAASHPHYRRVVLPSPRGVRQ